ncbi:MAG: glycosyltransferase family 4 protein, partial [Promethearchaeota archaeon]
SSHVISGGSEIQADLIIDEILSNGHEVFFISDLIRKPKKGKKDVKYFYLRSYGRKYSVLNFFSLIKALKKIDPDIIYQRWRVPYTGIAAWYKKRYSKKMVFNMASDSDPKKNRIGLNHMFVPNLINEYLGRYGIRHADLIVAQTNYQRELLKRNFNRESIVIPNGHPVPDPPFQKTFPPIILWAANIKPLKRLELFFELAKKLEYLKAQFFYIGRSSDKNYQKMLSSISNHVSNIRYLGELSVEDTNKLISEASILVNTSLHEGFPNTFVQAWMRETPVVSLNVDPDKIMQTYNIGFYSCSFDQFVQDVKFLIENPGERKKMGERARQYAVENYDIKKIGKKYLSYFEELMEEKVRI